jgi:hypothetical protein
MFVYNVLSLGFWLYMRRSMSRHSVEVVAAMIDVGKRN